MAEKLITKSFERLLDKGKYRGFITHEELGKSLGKRNSTYENIERAFIILVDEKITLVEKKSQYQSNKKKEAANQILYADLMLRQCDEVRQESESALHDCEVICQDIVNPMLKRSTRAVTLMNMADSNEFGALMAYNLHWRSKVVCTNNYQTL